MINLTICRTLLTLAFVFLAYHISGQETNHSDSAKIYQVKLTDGSEFIGNIVQQDSFRIVMQTSSLPRIEIPRTNIKSLEAIADANYKKGTYWFTNPHATRYLFGPSAFNLKKGEGYYQNTCIFFNSFNVGVTNHISIGGGLEFMSTFSSLSEGDFRPIFFITPKVSFNISEKFHVGGGIFYIHIPEANNEGAGIGYGMATYGTTDNNVTLGVGWGFGGMEIAERPIFTLSAMKRMSRKTGLITENWIIPADSYTSIWTYGIRFFGEKMAIDLALLNNADIARFFIIGIPYVDFVVKF